MPIPNPTFAAIKAAELAKRAKKALSPTRHYPMGSTAISDIWYNPVEETLWVKFRKVKAYPKYRFDGVPPQVVVELLNTHSAGQFYHDQLKGNYYSSEIKGPEDDGSVPGEMLFQLMQEK